MQDGYAQVAVFVDVGVERDRRLEGQGGWHVWVSCRENHASSEVASCIGGVWCTHTQLAFWSRAN
jgi:hypothetical protein